MYGRYCNFNAIDARIRGGKIRVDIDIIRERVEATNILIKSHAVQHALKEGF